MNRRYFAAGIALVILVIFASGAVSTKTTTQWEYGQLIVSTISTPASYSWKTGSESYTLSNEEMRKLVGAPERRFSTLDVFNHLGKEGWELFEFPDNQEKVLMMYYFKRCKP